MPSSAEKLKEVRRQAFASSKCTRCLAATPEDGKKTCKACREEIKNRKKEYRAAGKCVCGRKIRPTKSGATRASCYRCRRHNVKHKLKHRQEMIAAGICVGCFKRRALKPHQSCKICLRWMREDSRLSRRIKRLLNRASGSRDKNSGQGRSGNSSQTN